MQFQWNKKIYYITGKGGVGKSTLAAAIALRCGDLKSPSLLVELGDESYYSELFGAQIGAAPVEVHKLFHVSRWSGIEVLAEYVDHLVRWKGVGKVFFENPVMERLLKIAPGLYELALLGKASSGIRHHGPELGYSPVVMDSFSTGHSMAMLKAPKVMAESITKGPMHTQSRDILHCIQDPNSMQIFIVTTCEYMATEEALEFYEQLKSEFHIEPILILNKVFQEFSLIPELDNQFESYMHFKQQEQSRVRELLKNLGVSFLEAKYVLDAKDTMDFLTKVGEGL